MDVYRTNGTCEMRLDKGSRVLSKRLPLYLVHLRSLPKDAGSVSAQSIAKALGLGETTVRRDLGKISPAGRSNSRRSREQLIRDIEKYLGLSHGTDAIIVGVGMLGRALLDYGGWEGSGVNILAGFDVQPNPTDTENGKPIYPVDHLDYFCKCHDIHIGIIAVPEAKAQQVCDCLVCCGVKAILNLTSVQLQVPHSAAVQNLSFSASLTSLHLQLLEREETHRNS